MKGLGLELFRISCQKIGFFACSGVLQLIAAGMPIRRS
jgi:hypothetical protein